MDTLMRKRNIIIAILFIAGIMMFTTVQGIIIPRNEQRHEEYLKAQLNPTTHDFTQLLPYKTKYMGDASNLVNLFYHLPLAQYGLTFQLYPDILTAQINYKTDIATIGQNAAEKAMIYNATATFALIDNLKAVDYTFMANNSIPSTNTPADKIQYRINRQDVENWYGMKASQLTDSAIWKEKVQQQMKEPAKIKKASLALLREKTGK